MALPQAVESTGKIIPVEYDGPNVVVQKVMLHEMGEDQIRRIIREELIKTLDTLGVARGRS